MTGAFTTGAFCYGCVLLRARLLRVSSNTGTFQERLQKLMFLSIVDSWTRRESHALNDWHQQCVYFTSEYILRATMKSLTPRWSRRQREIYLVHEYIPGPTAIPRVNCDERVTLWTANVYTIVTGVDLYSWSDYCFVFIPTKYSLGRPAPSRYVRTERRPPIFPDGIWNLKCWHRLKSTVRVVMKTLSHR